ncbi:hypothetical protein DLM78_13110 [Leptospira stimsonii]|uniref:Uncharacterized protein n=1 Tax=Leptospira stimsonii TaxID=2202203 RepID=A0A8B3CT96_9LEPT|nr:hypothetical protein DLM78_13110 [Leptospira stimsonii]
MISPFHYHSSKLPAGKESKKILTYLVFPIHRRKRRNVLRFFMVRDKRLISQLRWEPPIYASLSSISLISQLRWEPSMYASLSSISMISQLRYEPPIYASLSSISMISQLRWEPSIYASLSSAETLSMDRVSGT